MVLGQQGKIKGKQLGFSKMSKSKKKDQKKRLRGQPVKKKLGLLMRIYIALV